MAPLKTLVRIVIVIPFLHAISFAEDGDQEFRWIGKQPDSQLRVDDIQCGDERYEIAANMSNPPRARLLAATKSESRFSDDAYAAIKNLFSSFERIDHTSFSCGGYGHTTSGEMLNLTDAFEVKITGRNKDERAEAADECWIMRGYYEDSTEASVVIMNDRVIKWIEPGMGTCITRFGPGVEIGDANSVDGASL